MKKATVEVRSIALLLLLMAAVSCQNPPQRFVLYRGDKNPWSCHVDRYDAIDHFAISPNGATVSFLGKKNGKWEFLISSGWKWKASDHARIENDPSLDTGRTLALSPDGSRVGIVYNRASTWRDSGPRPEGRDSGGQWFVDIDHHIFGGFDRDFKPTIHFSQDGRRFGFPYKKLGQYYVQVVDTTFGPYDRADMTITKDGEIVLGYIRQERAYIEKIYSPGQQ